MWWSRGESDGNCHFLSKAILTGSRSGVTHHQRKRGEETGREGKDSKGEGEKQKEEKERGKERKSYT